MWFTASMLSISVHEEACATATCNTIPLYHIATRATVSIVVWCPTKLYYVTAYPALHLSDSG